MSTVNGVTQSGSTNNAAAGVVTTKQDALAQKETFLNLLVAQIKNQDPLNPADGIQFISQLTQFSELEQMMEIRSSVEGLRTDLAPKADDATSTQTDASDSNTKA